MHGRAIAHPSLTCCTSKPGTGYVGRRLSAVPRTKLQPHALVMNKQKSKRLRTETVGKSAQQAGAPADLNGIAGEPQQQQPLQGQQQQDQIKLISQQPFKVPGLIVTDHAVKVPLDHSGKVAGQLTVFAREVASINNHSNRHSMPYLLFLQGGPGFECGRPLESSSWLRSAVSRFRVVLMDQRGTGNSSPITVLNLHKRGTPQEQADYLALFRADSIVRDAEVVRRALVPPENNACRWSVLGQSFGGFCALTYLSIAPEGLAEVFFTGGIPPAIDQPCSAEQVYMRLYRRVLTQNNKYYSRYPQDVQLVHRIVRCLQQQPEGGVRTLCGTLVTPQMLQLLGMTGLGAGGHFERLHYLLESFFDGDGSPNPVFLKGFDSWMPWDINPLYALLHESIYCQGAASNWAAHRVRQQHYAAEFDAAAALEEERPVMFTGEMVFPFIFDCVPCLRNYKAVADLLAAKDDWPSLYSKQALAINEVPAVAATYFEDMYVDFDLAQETAQHVANMRQWVTNEYKHSGIRDDGQRIFDKLCNIVRDGILLE